MPVSKTRYPEYNRAWVKAHPEQVAGYARKYRLSMYGLTPQTFQDVLGSQNNACAICAREFTRTPHVDHEHRTGKVRGLLCARCNTLVGYLEDPLRVTADKYIEENPFASN